MAEDLDVFLPPMEETPTARHVARMPGTIPDPTPDPEVDPVRTNQPLAVVWASRSAGNPHFVTIIHDPRGRRLQCVCTSAAIRGDCWAVQETRRLFGWPEPERT